MKTVNMYPHTGSGNHGCEAIVRSTKLLLGSQIGILFSDNFHEDKKYMPDVDLELRHANEEIKRFSRRHIKSLLRKYLGSQPDIFFKETMSPLLSVCHENSILLSIGGDLYCYDAPDYIYRVNRYARSQGCKTVLWGCSVEPTYIDAQMRADLQQYDLICARESITYDALKTINPNTILTVDPAFVLPAAETTLPSERYIGINVSPMITKRETVPGITMKNYRQLISYILDNTQDSAALIPHVVWSTNDDREPLKALKAEFADNDRVVLVEDHNAMQQKYIIAHCRAFVGARTHATIAAYSSCVPTLAVGYSVKAKGIAKDLFGRWEDYVLPVQSLKGPDDLAASFCWLLQHEEAIRSHLHTVMPAYMQRTQLAVNAVNGLEHDEK